MKNARLKTGDIVQLPLQDETYAIAQIVLLDFKKGAPLNPLLRVLDGRYRMEEVVNIDKIDLTNQLFPPVITGVGGAVKHGYWKKIGHRNVENFIYPSFISTIWSETTYEAGIWYLRNGTRTVILGKNLPEEYKCLEFDIILDPHDVNKRIETGKITYPFGELIRYNRFTPIINP